MKPLYWKILLILGAVIVAASLILPKTLRKNSNLDYDSFAHGGLSAQSGQNKEKSDDADIIFAFQEVVRADQAVLQLCVEHDQCPLGQMAYPRKSGGGYLMLQMNNIIDGKDVKKAAAGVHPTNNFPVINFTLNKNGRKKFCELKSNNIGEPFAIVLNGEILTAPIINGAICGGRGFIEGSFTMESAKHVALMLNAGTRPIKSRVVD